MIRKRGKMKQKNRKGKRGKMGEGIKKNRKLKLSTFLIVKVVISN